MNKQLLTLTLGLILVAPVCLAEEADTVAPVQDQAVQVSQPETAPVAETVSSDVVAPEQTANPEIQPEEMSEEQLKAFLDQLVAELQKEEENKKKAQQDGTEVQTTEAAPVTE